MLRPIVYWGASGQARVLAEFAENAGFRVVALFDNDPAVVSPLPGVPLFTGREGFLRWRRENPAEIHCLAAIGSQRGGTRLEVQRFMSDHGLIPAIVIHPTAHVAADARLSVGSQILVHAVVCAGAYLGEACIVNTKASVDHEFRLGDGVHIAPGATLAGCVEVGDGTMIGAGAVVLPRLRIGCDAVVGAGAIVTRNVPDGVVVYGNPARIRRSNEDRG